nr:MAG TPA: hypothetical protein [Caudoviricetes sp.]
MSFYRVVYKNYTIKCMAYSGNVIFRLLYG